jgi:tRNA-binding EMAP/Myf-like protein
MLISLDWIRDFCELDKNLTPKDLGLKLTMGTAEVESVEVINDFWKKIKTVEVTDIEPHPEADKLNLVRFKLNDDESFRVVCGAANVRVGMKTAFAPTGTTLPVGFTLEPKKIRGILSEGMLCSEEELGLADSSKGIMELSDDTPIGVDLLTLWEKNKTSSLISTISPLPIDQTSGPITVWHVSLRLFIKLNLRILLMKVGKRTSRKNWAKEMVQSRYQFLKIPLVRPILDSVSTESL